MDGINGSVGSSLSLVSISEVSHPKDCKGKHGRYVSVQKDQEGISKVKDRWVRCDSWNCFTCGPKKRNKVTARLLNGNMSQYVTKGKERFAYKMLTLTYPGGDRRKDTPYMQKRKEMSKAWDKLSRALKKRRGPFHHFKVFEPHKDGEPHLHVLMVGDAIAGKDVLNDIRELWVGRYGMGRIDIQVRPNNFLHAVRYITKYMTKYMGQLRGQFWSASRGALAAVWTKSTETFARFFSSTSESTGRTLVAVTDADMDFVDRLVQRQNKFLKPGPNAVLEELTNYFDVQSKRYWEVEAKKA